MTTTTEGGRPEGGRPERAWGVASVPSYPTHDLPPGADRSLAADGVFDRAEPATGLLRPLNVPIGQTSRPEQATATPVRPPAEATASRSDRHRRPEAARAPWSSRLRTLLAIAVLLVAAGVGGYQIVRHRLAEQAFVDLGSVLLTADAVPVGSAEAVVVTAVNVTQHARVAAGDTLATVTSATGRTVTLTAPVTGTVAAVEVAVGAVARGGEPIVTLYDQARLTFRADVPLAELRRMRLGMAADIEGPGLVHSIRTTLDHVVPVVGAGQPDGADRLTVVLVPGAADRSTVSTLVPGLRFTARIDTNTARDAVPAVNTG